MLNSSFDMLRSSTLKDQTEEMVSLPNPFQHPGVTVSPEFGMTSYYMSRLNLLLTATSLTVLLVTIERFSFTTKIILEPYSFLRLHEVVQMVGIILLTVIIPFFALQLITKNFELLKNSKGLLLGLLFIIGIYFYATGNGVHEVASYFYNTYCNTKTIENVLCGALFFNDYYFGNILYFIGAYLFTVPLLIFEQINPQKTNRKQIIITSVNACIYALAIFAYSAFDRVLVGLIFSILMLGTILYFALKKRKNISSYPYTFYSLIAYGLGTVGSLIVMTTLISFSIG